MKFYELFNQWIKELGCTARELSDATGLSAAVISRYRSGSRAPLKGSQQLEQLLAGLNELSTRGAMNDQRRKQLEEELTASLTAHDGAFERFYPRFDALLSTLGISMKELSRAVNYDISFLYRIRAGKRRPHDLEEFINRICSYAVLNRREEDDLDRLAELTGTDREALLSEEGRHKVLLEFLSRTRVAAQNTVEGFLRKMDTFALEDYSESLQFSNTNLSAVPPPRGERQLYYGVEQMRQGELAFFQQTIASRSREPIFMCTDMPMADMVEHVEFTKQLMLAVTAALSKGLRLNIIHELNRPWREMMIALEAWVPLYMTGQISPYYMSKRAAELYHHCLFVSGSVALHGECISGRHEHGRYELVTGAEELNYFRTRSRDLMRKARPLMEIYGVDRADEYEAFIQESQSIDGDRRNILSRPPLYTMPQTMLWEILQSSGVSAELRERIMERYLLERATFRSLTAEHLLEDKVSILPRELFEARPVMLPLPEWAGELYYNWEQYQAHIEETLSLRQENYRAVESPPAFRNIDICIVKGSHAIVAKRRAPAIRFVIRHPRLVAALENYVVLVQRN